MDSVHIMAEPGEYMLTKNATDMLGGAGVLDRINALASNVNPGMASPGRNDMIPTQPQQQPVLQRMNCGGMVKHYAQGGLIERYNQMWENHPAANPEQPQGFTFGGSIPYRGGPAFQASQTRPFSQPPSSYSPSPQTGYNGPTSALPTGGNLPRDYSPPSLYTQRSNLQRSFPAQSSFVQPPPSYAPPLQTGYAPPPQTGMAHMATGGSVFNNPDYTLKDGFYIRNGAEAQGVTPQSLNADRTQAQANLSQYGTGNDPYQTARLNYESQRAPGFQALGDPRGAAAQNYAAGTNQGIENIAAHQAVPDNLLPAGGMKPVKQWTPPPNWSAPPSNTRFATGGINGSPLTFPQSQQERVDQSNGSRNVTPDQQAIFNTPHFQAWAQGIIGQLKAKGVDPNTMSPAQFLQAYHAQFPNGGGGAGTAASPWTAQPNGGAANPEDQYQIDSQHGSGYFGPTNPGPNMAGTPGAIMPPGATPPNNPGNGSAPPTGPLPTGPLPTGGAGNPNLVPPSIFDRYGNQTANPAQYKSGTPFETGLPPLQTQQPLDQILLSPEYQIQKQQLNNELKQQLLSRGRWNSTYGIDKTADENAKLLAKEVDRQSQEQFDRNLVLNQMLYGRNQQWEQTGYNRTQDLAQMSLQAALGSVNLNSQTGTALANIFNSNANMQAILAGQIGTAQAGLADSYGGIPTQLLLYLKLLSSGQGNLAAVGSGETRTQGDSLPAGTSPNQSGE